MEAGSTANAITWTGLELRAGLMELDANIADLADLLSLRFHHAL